MIITINTLNTSSSGFSTLYVSAILEHGELAIWMKAPEETIEVSLPWNVVLKHTSHMTRVVIGTRPHL